VEGRESHENSSRSVCISWIAPDLLGRNGDPIVFFEEQFNGPAMDPTAWRTEILTSGPRFCCDTTAPWSPGHWVEEGEECHGVAAYSPYGSATLAGGLLSLSSSNVRAFPALMSRLPGPVPVFPASGDFTFEVRMRYDRVTPWGDGVVVAQAQSTEPVGDNWTFGTPEDVVLHLWSDPGEGSRSIRPSAAPSSGSRLRRRRPNSMSSNWTARDLVHD